MAALSNIPITKSQWAVVSTARYLKDYFDNDRIPAPFLEFVCDFIMSGMPKRCLLLICKDGYLKHDRVFGFYTIGKRPLPNRYSAIGEQPLIPSTEDLKNLLTWWHSGHHVLALSYMQEKPKGHKDGPQKKNNTRPSATTKKRKLTQTKSAKPSRERHVPKKKKLRGSHNEIMANMHLLELLLNGPISERLCLNLFFLYSMQLSAAKHRRMSLSGQSCLKMVTLPDGEDGWRLTKKGLRSVEGKKPTLSLDDAQTLILTSGYTSDELEAYTS